jgi:hypothetical protein
VTDLVRRYREYYREQTPSALDSLFRCMKEYDFSSYHDDMRRVSAMHRQAKCMGDSSFLRSGGSSTGRRRRYDFGPNFKHARRALEGFLRLSGLKTVSLVSATGLKKIKFESGEPPQSDVQLWGDWCDDRFLNELFLFVESLVADAGPINLSSKPHVWIQLTTNPTFRSWASPSLINAFINSDNIRCFYRPNCKVVDQMVDWSGGGNFYTCTFGTRHFLPTFYAPNSVSSVNLLNLKRHAIRTGDFISLEDRPTECRCGAASPLMQFVPHYANFPTDSQGKFIDSELLVDMASERTRFLQVYQADNGSFTVFHGAPSPERCARDIAKHLYSRGYGKTQFVTSRYLVVGTKVPFLWRGGKPSFEKRN